MPQDTWLAVLIAVSGVVALVLVAPVIPGLSWPRRPSTSRGSAQHRTRPDGPAEQRRRPGLLPTFARTHQRRSVEGNFERAFARIDAVDPYLAQRRIGEALAEVGLVSSASVFDDPPLPEQERSSGEVTDRRHRWDDEA